jgi:hypothetical protein
VRIPLDDLMQRAQTGFFWSTGVLIRRCMGLGSSSHRLMLPSHRSSLTAPADSC